ncbi:hypothetical protein JCM14076_11130 [Methylosoma difficile]
MLLHRRERETVGLEDKHFLPSWRALQYSQKKGLLAELAWRMVSKGSSSIESSDAKVLVAKTLHSIPGRAPEEADDVVQALVERSGMLRPAGIDRIDFIHNTLKEYLAAGCVVENGDWNVLTKNADDSAWQPVILFALALAPEAFSSGLVRELLDRLETIKNPGNKTSALTKSERKALATIKARQFFLVRCRSAAKRLAADLSEIIDDYFLDLLPPSSMNDAEALAQLGPRILNYASSTLENGVWWANQNSYMAIRCLRLLRLVGGQKAKAALQIIYNLPSTSTQLSNEWVLACNELSSDKILKWPFLGTDVYLSSHRITGLSPLGELTNLRKLFLNRTRVTSLNPLIKMTSLERLSIWDSSVNDLTPLAELTTLKSLGIFLTNVSDLSPLSELKQIINLDCSLTKVCELSPIGSLINLEYLELDRTLVKDIGPLKGLIKLKLLNLNKTQVVDLEPLENLCTLQALYLASTKITNLKPIISMDSLKSLILANNVDMEDFSDLAKLSSLQYLDLSGTKITDLTPLSNLSSLRSLNLQHVLINDLAPLAGLQSLEELHLFQINVTDLSPLIEIKSLKILNLGKTGVLDRDLEAFKTLRPDIRTKSISYPSSLGRYS